MGRGRKDGDSQAPPFLPHSQPALLRSGAQWQGLGDLRSLATAWVWFTVDNHFNSFCCKNHSDCNWVGEPQGRTPTCLGWTPDQLQILAFVTYTQSGTQRGTQLSRPSYFSSASPFSPPKAGEEKAEAWEGRAQVLSHLTRQSNSSSSTGRWQEREKLENKTSTSHWFQGTGWGGRNGTRPDRRQIHQSLSLLCQVLVQWGNPLPCAQLLGVAPPSPGSESLHPLPLGGLGVGVGGVGLAGMCGAGGRVGDRFPSLPPLGASEWPHPQASLSVLTGKEGMVTMVTGLSTVWPTNWGWCTT